MGYRAVLHAVRHVVFPAGIETGRIVDATVEMASSRFTSPERGCMLIRAFDGGACVDLVGHREPLRDDRGRPKGAWPC